MAVTVKIGGFEASIQDGQWSSDNKLLNDIVILTVPFEGVPTSEPDPDKHLADIAIEKLGGEIVSHDKPEFVEGRIY
jgi:hypothetical protein